MRTANELDDVSAAPSTFEAECFEQEIQERVLLLVHIRQEVHQSQQLQQVHRIQRCQHFQCTRLLMA